MHDIFLKNKINFLKLKYKHFTPYFWYTKMNPTQVLYDEFN